MRAMVMAIVVVFVPGLVWGQAAPEGVKFPEFAFREHKEAGGKHLLYRLLTPKDYEAGKSYPLVIWLHASSRGSDNQMQLASGVGEVFTAEPVRTKYQCFVIAPQCPSGDGWFGPHLNKVDPETETIRMLLATMVELGKEYRIDYRRIYIGGFSMGAYGTWQLISRHPDLAAAAFPMGGCWPGWEKICLRFKDVPIWIFQGEKDDSMSLDWVRQVVAALQQGGGNVRYTEYPGGGHGSALQGFQEPGFWDWLFAQQRATPADFAEVTDPENSVVVTKTLLVGTHGTWKGPVQRTSHGAPRIAIDTFRYRLHATEGAPAAMVATIDGIGKGTVTGVFEVTGTVFTDDGGYMAINVESLKAVP